MSLQDQITIKTEDDVVRILKGICKWYDINYPMSPVPLILKKAISLIGKDFYETMDILTDGKYGNIKVESGIVFIDKATGKIIDAASLPKYTLNNQLNKNDENSKEQKDDIDSSESEAKNNTGTEKSRDSGKLNGNVKNNF